MIPASHVTAGHLVAAGFLGLTFTGWYYAVEYARKRACRRFARRKAQRRWVLREAAVASLDLEPQQRQQEIDMWLRQRSHGRGVEPVQEGEAA